MRSYRVVYQAVESGWSVAIEFPAIDCQEAIVRARDAARKFLAEAGFDSPVELVEVRRLTP